MLPSGWLGELMAQFDWAPPCGLVPGSVGNFDVVDMKYVGRHADQWFFIGTAQAPCNHLCCCCLEAEGSSLVREACDVVVPQLVHKRKDYSDWPDLDLFNY